MAWTCGCESVCECFWCTQERFMRFSGFDNACIYACATRTAVGC